MHLCQQLSLQIVEAQDAGLDVYLEPIFVHLPKAHDVGGEAWDVIEPIKPMVLAGLAREEDDAFALDVDHRAVAEFYGADDTGIQYDEDNPQARHVIRRTSVEHPATRNRSLLLAEMEEHLRFIEVDMNRRLDEVQR